jgi:hypothetical protein
VEQNARPEVDEEIQLESESQQDVPSVLVAGNARISYRAEKNRVNLFAEMLKDRFRKGLSAPEIMVGAVRQSLPGDAPTACSCRGLNRRDGSLDDLGSDPITADDGDPVAVFSAHSAPQSRLSASPSTDPIAAGYAVSPVVQRHAFSHRS